MIPKLEVTGLSYSYHTPEGETEALTDISFQAAAGEFLAVVGPSGCGKSTLLSLISGLLTPDSGSVLLDGEPVRRGNTKIGYMLQRDHLFEWRSILKNAALGLEIQNQTDAAHQEKVRRLLSAYGLELFSRSKPSELSGGMRQRAALIRTLALEPDLLLLDEPFSACDDISTIIRSAKKTALLVTHDLSEAVSAADRILVLTKRPAKIKGELSLQFPGGETSPLKRRNCPQFSSYFNQLWELLKEHPADRQEADYEIH